MTFNIFKKSNKNSEAISSRLANILNQKPNNLHVTICIQNQILFQIMPAKNFIQHGFKTDKPNDLVAIHFFNKNKTLTFDSLNNIKDTGIANNYYFYEKPKGNYNYIKSICLNPIEIETEILKNIKEIYELENLNNISIEYADY